jgi:hypothetical protein
MYRASKQQVDEHACSLELGAMTNSVSESFNSLIWHDSKLRFCESFETMMIWMKSIWMLNSGVCQAKNSH